MKYDRQILRISCLRTRKNREDEQESFKVADGTKRGEKAVAAPQCGVRDVKDSEWTRVVTEVPLCNLKREAFLLTGVGQGYRG